MMNTTEYELTKADGQPAIAKINGEFHRGFSDGRHFYVCVDDVVTKVRVEDLGFYEET
jgi:hypothetical protein